MIARFQVIPAAYVLLRRDDQVLLQLRQNTSFCNGFWASGAAGHVEQGESVFAAAAREAREELGIDIAMADLQPLTVLHQTGEPHGPSGERVDFFFICTRWLGEPRRMEPHKAADLRWFPLGDLPEHVVPQERFVFEALRDGVVTPVMAFGFDAAG